MKRALSGEREGHRRMGKENSDMRAPLPMSAAAAASAASSIRATRADDVFYPSSDGKPMAENMWGADAIMNAASDLRAVRPNALVAANILLYPEKGNNKKSLAPDVLVAFGIGTHNRSSYLVWEEGKPPAWVLEVASPSTQAKDRKRKLCDYAKMGVREYWLFDAKGDVYPKGAPRLQGLRLKDGKYHPLDSHVVDGKRMVHSEELGLDVRAENGLLRFWDPATRKDVRHRSEVEADEELAQAAAEQAQVEASEAAAQRKTAEARAQRESARADLEAAHAKQESARAAEEAARAEREAASRSAAEARVAELEAALRLSRAGHPRE